MNSLNVARQPCLRRSQLFVAATVFCAILITAGLMSSSWAQTYTFHNIADTSGAFANFGGAPVINNNGDIAFTASLYNGVRGIYSGFNPAADTIADSQGEFDQFRYPSINDEGEVAFRAFVDPSEEHTFGGSGIFTGDDVEEDAIAIHYVPNDPPDPWGSFDSPSINNEGEVAFGAFLATGVAGIFTGNDPATDTYVTSASLPFGSTIFAAAMNDDGTVAFFASLDAGGGGIFTGSNLAQDTVADSSGPYNQFGIPAINNEGIVVFMATLDAGGRGIFTGSNSVSDAIVTTSGPYSSFTGEVSINNEGDVVFTANLDAGGFGLFTGPDSVADKVIRNNDPLFGSTVTSLFLSTENLNDSGEVAFMYHLANGKVGIAVASPEAAQPGDYNGNDMIDAADYTVWRDALTAGSNSLLNDPTPGTVTESDFLYWRDHFGESLGSGGAFASSAAAVPEPSTLSILLMATLAILSRQRSAVP